MTKKVALVTGANTGIGFQVARAVAKDGYRVYIGARSLQKGEAAAAEIGRNAIALHLDITDKYSIDAAATKIKDESGYLTLFVNNAAICHSRKPGRTMEEILVAQKAICIIDELRAVWNTNVFSTLVVTQVFLPLLKSAPSARIVTVSSALGSFNLNANPNNPYRGAFDAVYGASKTASNGVF